MSLDRFAPLISGGDENAFSELYALMRRSVYAVCLAIIKNASIAEELTQDTFATVWTHSSTFRGKGYKTWILTCAKNLSLNELAKRKREVAVDFTENEDVAGSYTIENEIEASIVLDAALKLLDETDRQIVLMKNTDIKTKDIAAYLGMPRGTVSWRYSEALKKMKRYLEGG